VYECLSKHELFVSTRLWKCALWYHKTTVAWST